MNETQTRVSAVTPSKWVNADNYPWLCTIRRGSRAAEARPTLDSSEFSPSALSSDSSSHTRIPTLIFCLFRRFALVSYRLDLCWLKIFFGRFWIYINVFFGVLFEWKGHFSRRGEILFGPRLLGGRRYLFRPKNNFFVKSHFASSDISNSVANLAYRKFGNQSLI